MRVNTTYTMARRLEQLIGIFLASVGIGFIVLFAYVELRGQLAGDVKVSAFMLTAGAALVWIGYRFLKSNPDEAKTRRSISAFLNSPRLILIGEVMAVAGCVAMLLRGICSIFGISWPPEPAFYIFLVGPVLVGQIVLKALKPGALQNGVVPPEVAAGWSAGARFLLSSALRLGWLGYIAIPFAWPSISARLPLSWSLAVQLLACCLISVLYATQTFMLHFGDRRT